MSLIKMSRNVLIICAALTCVLWETTLH
jgi:hypothetical protein